MVSPFPDQLLYAHFLQPIYGKHYVYKILFSKISSPTYTPNPYYVFFVSHLSS